MGPAAQGEMHTVMALPTQAWATVSVVMGPPLLGNAGKGPGRRARYGEGKEQRTCAALPCPAECCGYLFARLSSLEAWLRMLLR